MPTERGEAIGKPGRAEPQRPHRGKHCDCRPGPWPPLWLILGRLSCATAARWLPSKRTSTGNGAPQGPATRRPEPPQSTETVPTRAACSLRATERAVSRGMSLGFCTGRPRRPI
jgi:hypothetical protein